jgi:methionyl-tRNA formyltransferase
VPDAGVDTGPIVVQKGGVEIADGDNAASLYFDKLYPLGVDAVLEAVDAVDRGTARPRAQDESRASFQGLVTDEVARIDWDRPAADVARLVRGCDPNPGAHALRASGERVRLYDARLAPGASDAPPGTVLGVEGGRVGVAARGGRVTIGKLRVGEGAKTAAAEAGLEGGERLR